PFIETLLSQGNGQSISIRIARDLIQDPIASTDSRQHDSWSEFRLRQIGKREWDQNYFTGCRCDHAESSSGRFQSARASSLSAAASSTDGIASSRSTTRTRRELPLFMGC